jgi:hypothetical protein
LSLTISSTSQTTHTDDLISSTPKINMSQLKELSENFIEASGTDKGMHLNFNNCN